MAGMAGMAGMMGMRGGGATKRKRGGGGAVYSRERGLGAHRIKLEQQHRDVRSLRKNVPSFAEEFSLWKKVRSFAEECSLVAEGNVCSLRRNVSACSYSILEESLDKAMFGRSHVSSPERKTGMFSRCGGMFALAEESSVFPTFLRPDGSR